MKKLVVAWVAGFVFAIALVVRWQLMSNPPVETGNGVASPEPTEESEPSASGKPAGVLRLASAGWESVRAGALADVGRLRNLVEGARPASDSVPKPAVDTLATEGVAASAG